MSLIVTFIISLFDGLSAAGVNIEVVSQVFTKFLPMQEVGLGWIFPAIIGGFIGYGLSILKVKTKFNQLTRADKKIG